MAKRDRPAPQLQRPAPAPIGRPIWDQTYETPPGYTKLSNNGRFDFTSVDPHYLLQEATRLWGEYGDKWGIRDLKWTVLPEHEYARLDAVFFYPHPEDDHEVSFEYSVDEKWRKGFDHAKIMITGLRSKCLSQLGFAADVYLGMFDDAQYVHDLDIKYGEQETVRKEALSAIKLADSEERLNALEGRVKTLLSKDTIPPAMAAELFDQIAGRRVSL